MSKWEAVASQVDDLQGLLAQSDMAHYEMRIEKLRAALLEVLPYVDGTIGEERPVVAAKIKKAPEVGE